MRLLLKTIRNSLNNPVKVITLLLCLLGLGVLLVISAGDGQPSGPATSAEISTLISLPLLGEVDAKDFSLPVLAMVLGLVDGFNPCAMWVLVYLISLIASLNDRRKIWVLVGSFVGASGILYFLFMAAWLNAFLLLGYLRHLTLIIGFFALWVGINNLYETIQDWGKDPTCQVGDMGERQKTASRIRKIVAAPLNVGGLMAIIGLAFVVNSIEFLCSAAIPAVFTHVLAISRLNAIQYYLDMLIYVFFFMLDDMVIFATAAFAMTSGIGEKYLRFSKPLGGVVLLGLGVVLIFFPDWLR